MYQLEGTTVDTYNNVLNESQGIDTGTYDTNKHNSWFSKNSSYENYGSWTLPITSLKRTIEETAATNNVFNYSSNPQSVTTKGYHVSYVLINPDDETKTKLSVDSHRNAVPNTICNSNMTSESDYGIHNQPDSDTTITYQGYDNEELDPSKVNHVYVYMERNWKDIIFSANDNIGLASSSKAKLILR